MAGASNPRRLPLKAVPILSDKIWEDLRCSETNRDWNNLIRQLRAFATPLDEGIAQIATAASQVAASSHSGGEPCSGGNDGPRP